MTLQQIEHEMLAYPPQDRLRLARMLLDSLTNDVVQNDAQTADNPLLKWAGIFDAGPADVAERAEDILFDAVDPESGFAT